jgi:hypothetical protein
MQEGRLCGAKRLRIDSFFRKLLDNRHAELAALHPTSQMVLVMLLG